MEQGRAAFAFERAKNAVANTGLADEYKSYAKSLPMMIKNSGLGATLAFIRSKSTNKEGKITAYGQLYNDIQAWFKEPHKAYLVNLSDKELVQAVIDMDSDAYRTLTVEALAYLQWLRRFAEALAPKNTKNENKPA